MKEENETLEKELNKMEISNLSDPEFKALDTRMLKELSEDLSSTKNIQSQMKNTLSKIKNNLQGNNSRVDEAKNRIDDLEYKEAKNHHQSEQKEEKRMQKSEDSVYKPLGQLQEVQRSHHRGTKGEKKKQEIRNLFGKNSERNLS